MSTLFDTLLARNEADWQRYVQHDFVRQLGAGTLPLACFEHYLKQDYIFLFHFARAFGLAAFKSTGLDELRHAMHSLHGIVDVELGLHVNYCAERGITEEELRKTVEATPNMAYTRFVLERGLAGDLLELNVALAPCIIGYAHVARWLQQQPFLKQQGNPYLDWIEMYASTEYRDVAAAHLAAVNRTAVESLPAQRVDQLAGTFGSATRLEIDFWQMGLVPRNP